MIEPPYDVPDHGPYCSICGTDLEWSTCWQCDGEGGWHDCGEDCCVCLDNEEITVDCDECDGDGGYWECPGLPHQADK